MPDLELFQAALGLTPAWQVIRTDFDPAAGQLDLEIGFERGARFGCPKCAEPCPVYDAEAKTWRHFNSSSTAR